MSFPHNKNECLTEIEVYGLTAAYNLADGHSYLSAQAHYPDVLASLPKLWIEASNMSVSDMEAHFKNTFARYFELKGLHKHEHYSVCPTASNSIDIVAAWARASAAKVGLIEPTFDNLAQLLKRREVDLVAIPEDKLYATEGVQQLVREHALTALFLVNPNNPTGKMLDQRTFTEIADFCKVEGITLILDASFRFCAERITDEYAVLRQRKASFIILEDTGKQWPTLDTKVSLLAYSADIAPIMRQIYEEIYLCTSNFALQLLASFIDSTIRLGGLPYIQMLIRRNCGLVRAALEGTGVCIESSCSATTMSVLWLNIKDTGMTDLAMISYLANYDVAVLPGRYFYWDSHQSCGHQYIRLALMKPDEAFAASVNRLRQALLDLTNVQQRGIQQEQALQ